MRTDPFGIEKLIQDAQKEGKFDDLAGKGEPLHVRSGDLASVFQDVLRDNGVVPEWIELRRQIETLRDRQSRLIDGLEQRRAGDRAALEAVLRAGPEPSPERGRGWSWFRVRHRSDGEAYARAVRAGRAAEIAERMERDRRRTLLQVAELIRLERRQVDRYNLLQPLSAGQMRRVQVEERLAAFQRRFPTVSVAETRDGARIYERVEPVEPHLLVDATEIPAPTRTRRSEQVEALQVLRAAHRRPPPIG